MKPSFDMNDIRAFFTRLAPGWDDRAPAGEDELFAAAVARMELRPGMTVLDLGCGSGRAIPWLRAAVGPAGRVLAADATPAMLDEARRLGRGNLAELVCTDVLAMDLPDGAADAIFAGGLLPHLTDPAVGLAEMARLLGPGGLLAVFHPISRAVMAQRHTHAPSDDAILEPATLEAALSAAGFRLLALEDGQSSYLALARRA